MTLNKEQLISQLIEDESFRGWVNSSNKIDVDYWNAWIHKNSDKLECFEIAKAIVRGVDFKKNPTSTTKIDNEFAKVLLRLNSKPNRSKKFSSKAYKSYALAAVLLILIFVGIFQILTPQNSVTHKTTYGEILDLQLPDGTSVVLNGNSKISYTKDNVRSLSLTGEAYFKVKSIPSTKAKFWVHTNDLKVEVLGTMFHINTRKKKTKVVLDEGSVHLKLKNGLEKEMIPGDMISFSKDDNQISHKSVSNTTTYSLWRDGTYTFNNISLKEVMKNIEFTYGLKAIFKDQKLKDFKLSGGIPNQNLVICIAAIEKVTGTRIRKMENQLIINKN